jgi:hypothetical protein
MVIAAQQQAQHETYRILTPLLSDDTKTRLDGLLVPDVSRGGTALTWLRRAAVSNTPKAILRNIEKLEFLKGAGVARWALGDLSPNRLKRLAQIARRATGQAGVPAPSVRKPTVRDPSTVILGKLGRQEEPNRWGAPRYCAKSWRPCGIGRNLRR